MTRTMTSSAAQQDLRALLQRFIDDVINTQDLDGALVEMVAENFVELNPLPGQGPGRAGLGDVLAMMLPASRTCAGRSTTPSSRATG